MGSYLLFMAVKSVAAIVLGSMLVFVIGLVSRAEVVAVGGAAMTAAAGVLCGLAVSVAFGVLLRIVGIHIGPIPGILSLAASLLAAAFVAKAVARTNLAVAGIMGIGVVVSIWLAGIFTGFVVYRLF